MESSKSYDEGAIEKTPEHIEIRKVEMPSLSDYREWEAFTKAAEKAVNVFATLDDIGRDPALCTGGYLSVMRQYNNVPLGKVKLVQEVGIVAPEKKGKYGCFCLEKPKRLLYEKHMYGQENTSYASRNPDQNKWGGAVMYGVFVFAFSGLPELGDECVSSWVAIDRGYATHEQVISLLEWHNPFVKPFLEKMKELNN